MMHNISQYLMGRNTAIKLLTYLNLIIIVLYGPLLACLLLVFICFGLLTYWPYRTGLITNPWSYFLLCIVAILIVVPGGTKSEIVSTSILCLRVLSFLLLSSLLGCIFSINDALWLGKFFHWPCRVTVFFISIVRFIPLAMKSFEQTLISQRARGLTMKNWRLLRFDTFTILVVPFIVAILRDCLFMWISINMRNWVTINPSQRTIRTIDIAFVATLSCLWLIPY